MSVRYVKRKSSSDRQDTVSALSPTFTITSLKDMINLNCYRIRNSHVLKRFFFFTTVLSHLDFSHGKFGFPFPGKSQLRRSRGIQPTVHAVCFRVSIIHRTLTWTTGPLTCAHMLKHVIEYEGKKVCTES